MRIFLLFRNHVIYHIWWANLELNQDSTDYESVALPLSYWPLTHSITLGPIVVKKLR